MIGLLTFFLTACASAQPVPSGPRVVILPESSPSVEVRVEVARTLEEHQRGLMHRRSLETDRGMLFVYDDDEVRNFWMVNTLISLDMIFIDAERRVVGVVHDAEPETRTTRTVGVPSRYVLEVNGGFCRNRGIDRGASVRFEGFAP